ncbi:MATE family efflux transporter [Halobium salinum]|uniref:MATE family efflux transporter n=1 Tax=Halobium salinum TaxID=1364940 RepID=A0ABD5PEQ1_9EURY|nr:MATE family efflux transporter [Halobium salinum]
MSLFKDREEFDLTSGGIAKPLFFLSLPIVVTNLMQTAYNLADTFWLGQYSTEALAAISFAFPMVFLLISFGMGISVAGSVLVAQHTGADEPRKAEYAASQTVTFAVLFSLVFGAVGYVVVGPFLSVLGASPEVLPLATGYMRIISLGLVSMFGFWVFVSLMRGYGDTITPMLVMFGSVVVNIAIDPFLIFGFESNPLFGMLSLRGLEASLFAATGYGGSGVAGAAIATVFARSLAMVVGLLIMFRGNRGVEIHLSDMAPDFGYVERLVRIGAPASVEVGGRALSVNLMLFVIGLFPTTVVAGYGIGVRVFSVVFLPAIAVARGVETMSGQNLGAEKPDRAAAANHFAAKAMFLVLAGVGVVTWVAAGPVVAVFTDDPEVLEVGTTFLRYVAPTFGFIGVMRAYTGGFRGAGKTMVAAAVSIFMLGVVRLPLAWVLARLDPANLAWLPVEAAAVVGANGIWLSFAVSNVVGATVAYLWFKTGSWREADLTERGASAAGSDD